MRPRRVPRVLVILAALALSAPGARADDKSSCAETSLRGQEARDHRHLLDAQRLFVQCSAESCPLIVRRDCAEWLEGLKTRVPGVVVSARDAEGRDVVDVRVLVDGALVQPRLDGHIFAVDPGEHVFRFEPAGAPPIEQRVLVREGETNRLLTVDVQGPSARGAPPPDTSRGGARPVTWPTFVFGGLAIAGGVAFAGFAATAKGDLGDLRDGCGRTQTCAQSDVDAVRRDLVIANVALGIGVLALGAAIWTYVTRPEVHAP